MKYSRFEDLPVWKAAVEFALKVFEFTNKADFRGLGDTKGQLERAALSISNNIAEGFERGRRAEFHQFLSIAKASCAEVRTQIYLACDVEHIDGQTRDTLLRHAEEVARIIGGLRAAVSRTQHSVLSTQHS